MRKKIELDYELMAKSAMNPFQQHFPSPRSAMFPKNIQMREETKKVPGKLRGKNDA